MIHTNQSYPPFLSSLPLFRKIMDGAEELRRLGYGHETHALCDYTRLLALIHQAANFELFRALPTRGCLPVIDCNMIFAD